MIGISAQLIKPKHVELNDKYLPVVVACEIVENAVGLLDDHQSSSNFRQKRLKNENGNLIDVKKYSF